MKTPAATALRSRLEAGGVLSCTGVSRAAQPCLAVWVRTLFPTRPVVVVTEGVKTQEGFHQDIETWLRLLAAPSGTGPEPSLPGIPGSAFFYPSWEVLPHEARLPHADVISERLETLVNLSQPATTAPLVVTTAQALMQRTFPPEAIAMRTRVLRRGGRIEPLDLVEWLEDQGYEPEAKVTSKGEISLRGGILDVYPPTSPWPVRLEFFGDELESLRFFDPATQISRPERTDTLTIPPAGEIGLLRHSRTASSGGAMEPHSSLALATLADYLPPDTIMVLCEPALLTEHTEAYGRLIPARDPFFIPWGEVLDLAGHRGMTLFEVSETKPDEAPDGLSLALSNLDAFRPLAGRAADPQITEVQRREFFHQLHRWLRQDHAVHVFFNNDGERQRFGEIWEDYGLNARPETETGPSAGLIPTRHIGALTRGFLSHEAKLVVVTDAEIFGRYKVQRARRLKSPHAVAARSALDIDFTELAEGDFVVHVQHGIGRYLGLQTLPAGLGRKGTPAGTSGPGGQECLVIEYAPADADQAPPKLYVPVTEAHLVSKYVGAGKARPALNTLGGPRWAKTRAQAEQAVRDLAAELLSIQAARESQPGFAFPPDTPWQREFESAFLYEETPDQMRAIVATKRDLERPKPMDRLICGDVGYGKTEVAIRAAFKTVMSGRQAAILVPTTVLAQQHFNTFRERMADYPVRIEQLSRFRTRREQAQVLQGLAGGAVDIVIGTHRLIQADVVFKDLGLVVIDEEQRFGVMHKEKFKLLRRLVDVLTLSATPIPRTLYLALTGARDMSTIETPPQDRLPVETIVTQYDERLIRDAIQRELNREGQVYFLHNRVFDIEQVAARIKTLVPRARVLVGHGQMDADDLEAIMTRFVNGEADVLVSTTIIESGIDIPNANTIIIDRADRFGLSDLYQLRGRVGRYKHQAYAYLLLPRHARLLSDVRQRISAIKQYSSLGSGFKIAMRDLEIRGAGNLLGPQQSGHITAVGFELYCQLLNQSVRALKGEKVKPRIEVPLRLDFLAMNEAAETGRPKSEVRHRTRPAAVVSGPREVATYINDAEPGPESACAATVTFAGLPLKYIPEPHQRIEIYRKLAQVTDKESLERLAHEVRDRFGKPPPPVELLLRVAELKSLAAERGVTAIETRGDKLMLTRHGDYLMVGGKFPRLTKHDAKARLHEIKKLLLAL